MLAFTLTALIAVYLLGPGLVFRLVLGLFVSVRTVIRSRSEEITWALTIAVFPVALSALWATSRGVMHWRANTPDLQMFFACLNSDSYFKEHAGRFYHALFTFCWMNAALLWRIYAALLIPSAIAFGMLARSYGRISRLPFVNRYPWIRSTLDWLVLHRVSAWHIQLSRFTLDPRTRLEVDVLTVSGTLYQGQLEASIIGNDSRLSAIVLSEPRRFDREPYLRLKDAGHGPRREDFWKTIPSQNFLINGSDVSTINSRYALPTDDETLDALRKAIEG